MDRDEAPRRDKERTLNFGLLIQKTITEQGASILVESHNQGIPDPEVILIVEAWLENVKDRFKGPIKDGMTFKGDFPKA